MVLLATLLYGIAINLSVPLERRHGALPVLLRAQLFAIVLVAPLLGVVFRGESVAASALLGTALVIFGAYLTSRKEEPAREPAAERRRGAELA